MFNSTAGQAKEPIDITEQDVEKMKENGTLVIDTSRRRPLYFDGRFLAASDLSMEQNYFISRQATLGRAVGGGVIDGLEVEENSEDARSIEISSGHGLTRGGDMVMLADNISVNLADVGEAQQLNVAFGLSEIPKTPVANRSGLFIVALRPVEYTAHPIAVYPTSVTGKPVSHGSTATGEVVTQDGDIVSAVAVVLIPYQDLGTTSELLLRRATAAREIFIDGKEKGIAAGILPLSMIALQNGVIRWIDNHMVRRLMGNEHRDILGLGFAPRGLREAYFRQYERHLRYILNNLSQHNSKRISASDYFFSLPACGPMPKSVINPDDFTQSFFPAEMEVDLSIIPDDELAPLIEESLLLPPIDLSLSGEDFESTSIMVLIPVSRARLRTLSAELSSVTRDLKTAAPGQQAKKNPLESLYELTRKNYQTPSLIEGVIGEDAWRQLLAENDMLWYLRRRNISYKAEIASIPITGGGTATPGEPTPGEGGNPPGETPPVDTPPTETPTNPPDPMENFVLPGAVKNQIERLELMENVTSLVASSNAAGRETLAEFLSFSAFRDAPDVMFYSAVNELYSSANNTAGLRNTAIKIPGKTTVFDKTKNRVSAELIKETWNRFEYNNMGSGILKLEKTSDELKGKVYLDNLGMSNAVPEFDKAMIRITKPELVKEVVEKSLPILLAKKQNQHLVVAEFIQEFVESTKGPEKDKEPGGVIVPPKKPPENDKGPGGIVIPPKERPEREEPGSVIFPPKKEDEIIKPPKETPVLIGRPTEIEEDKKNKIETPDIVDPGVRDKINPGIKTRSTGLAEEMQSRLDGLSLLDDFQQLQEKATNNSVKDSLRELFESEELSSSQDLVVVAAVDEIKRAAKKASNKVTKAIVASATRTFKNSDLSKAITRLVKLEPLLPKHEDYINVLGKSGLVSQLASIILAVDKKADLKEFGSELRKVVEAESTKKLSTLQTFIRQAMKTYKVKMK